MQVTYQTMIGPKAGKKGNRGTRLAKRLQRLLARFSSGVSNVKVNLKGHRSGHGNRVESTCQLHVELRDGGQVLVTGRGRRLNQAVRHALKRARHIVAAEIRRRRQRSRQRVRHQEVIPAGA
jgi:hypothetical protein